jgi:DNA-directed RNA polymerase subunit RPC12/RpoP
MERHLFVICEECGKKYRVDTAKIIGLAAGFSCRSCGHRILVARPRPGDGSSAEGPNGQPPAPDGDLPPPVYDTVAAGVPALRPAGGAGNGLRMTAALFFFVLPALITAAAGFFFWDQVAGMIDASQRHTALTLLMTLGGFILAALGIGLLFGMRLAGRAR